MDWLPVTAALILPAIVVSAPLALDSARPTALCFYRNNWGNIASLWGLGVSLGAFFFAKGAKKAAEEARSAERLRTALAGLEDAATKCAEIGQSAGSQKWAVVELRALEVLTCCRTTLAAWGESDALTDSRRRLGEVATQMESIVEESRNANVNGAKILKSQLQSAIMLSVVLGKIQKHHTSGGS